MNRITSLLAAVWIVLHISAVSAPARYESRAPQDTIQSIRGKRKNPKKPAVQPRKPSRKPQTRATLPHTPRIKSALHPTPPMKTTPRVVVAQGGNGKCRTIGEAVKAAPTGAQIVIRGGTYRESIVINKSVELIPASADDPVVIESSTEPALFIPADHATVRDITIQIVGPEQSRANTAVDISAGHSVLDHCDIIGGRNACVAVHGVSADPMIRNCTVHRGTGQGIQFADRCHGTVDSAEAYDNGASGIDVEGGASPKILRAKLHNNQRAGLVMDYAGKVELDNVEACANQWVGIACRHLSTATIRFCRIHSNTLIGLWVVESSVVTAELCDSHDNGGSGIELIGVLGTTVKGCHSWANKEHGIHVWDAKVTLDGCESDHNGLAGIFLQGETPIARLCKVHDNQRDGIHISDGGIADVADCDVFANGAAGIWVNAAAHPTVKTCTVHDNKIDGITITDPPTTGTIIRCDVYGNAASGIGIMDGDPKVQSCHIFKGNNGLAVANRGTGTVEDCDITENSGYGVAVMSTGNPYLNRCTLRGNKRSGLFIDDGGFGTFKQCDIYENGAPNADVRRTAKPIFYACRIP